MNTVRLAAAGAGKTWQICNSAIAFAQSNGASRVLLISYTNKGIDSIKGELEKQNAGVIPANITVLTWYQFLLRELIRPYQTYIAGINEIKSLDFSLEHTANYAKAGTKARYITRGKNVRSEEASNLLLLLNQKSGQLPIKRLEKVYSCIYFDEIQDLAGRDIEVLELLLSSNIDVVCVGDNKQSTFQTHSTRTNRAKTGKNIFDYFYSLEKSGIVQIEEALCSRRFNPAICQFANLVYPNSKNITTIMNETTEHDGVFIISKMDAMKYYSYYHPHELRYSIKTTDICGPFATNFGECKGKTFDRCMIYPTEPFIKFLKGKKLASPEKYYVAVTRARYSNAIVVDTLFGAVGFEKCKIKIGGETIDAERFINAD